MQELQNSIKGKIELLKQVNSQSKDSKEIQKE
jgi:hypothetical protein